MDACDVGGFLIKMGVNKVAERAGLAPIPVGQGVGFDLEPGFLVKQEFMGMCSGQGAPVYSLDLTQLAPLTQKYLQDRLDDLHDQVQSRQNGQQGDVYSSPSFALGVIGLPGSVGGSVVIWNDPKGGKRLNGVVLRYGLDL